MSIDDEILYKGQRGTIRKIHSNGQITIRYSRENRGIQEWVNVSESEIIPFAAAQLKQFEHEVSAQRMQDIERS
jgi:hypothetical protein